MTTITSISQLATDGAPGDSFTKHEDRSITTYIVTDRTALDTIAAVAVSTGHSNKTYRTNLSTVEIVTGENGTAVKYGDLMRNMKLIHVAPAPRYAAGRLAEAHGQGNAAAAALMQVAGK